MGSANIVSQYQIVVLRNREPSFALHVQHNKVLVRVVVRDTKGQAVSAFTMLRNRSRMKWNLRFKRPPEGKLDQIADGYGN